MALTTEQLAKRHLSLGASEMAAVVGVSPYKSAADVWSEKVNGRPPCEQRLLDLAEWGDLIEPCIREWYSRRLPEGAYIIVPSTVTHPTTPWATATPDGIIQYPTEGTWTEPSVGLEIKNRGKDDKPRWVDHVPCEVAAQCQWGMHVTGLHTWHVIALLNGNTPYVHVLNRDNELIRAMVVVGEVVWAAVQGGKDDPPDLSWVEYEVGLIRDRLVNDADEAAFRRAAYWKKREGK